MYTGIETVGLLGKIPLHGDFIHLNANSSIWRSLDEWIQNGFYLAQQKGAFEVGYYNSEGYAFYYPLMEYQAALLGFIQPSQDSIGRKFPLIVAHEVPAAAGGAAVDTIMQYSAFLQAARQLAVEGSQGNCPRENLSSRLHQLNELAANNGEQTSSARWSDNSWQALVEQSWGHFEEPLKYLSFKNLADMVAPLRQGVPSRFTLGFRFKGCNDERLSLPAAAFWGQTFFRTLGQTAIQPSLFWRMVPLPAADASSILIFLSSPPAKILIDMLPAESESDFICDMHQIGIDKKDQVGDVIPFSLKQALQSPEASLADVLTHLS